MARRRARGGEVDGGSRAETDGARRDASRWSRPTRSRGAASAAAGVGEQPGGGGVRGGEIGGGFRGGGEAERVAAEVRSPGHQAAPCSGGEFRAIGGSVQELLRSIRCASVRIGRCWCDEDRERVRQGL